MFEEKFAINERLMDFRSAAALVLFCCVMISDIPRTDATVWRAEIKWDESESTRKSRIYSIKQKLRDSCRNRSSPKYGATLLHGTLMFSVFRCSLKCAPPAPLTVLVGLFIWFLILAFYLWHLELVKHPIWWYHEHHQCRYYADIHGCLWIFV